MRSRRSGESVIVCMFQGQVASGHAIAGVVSPMRMQKTAAGPKARRAAKVVQFLMQEPLCVGDGACRVISILRRGLLVLTSALCLFWYNRAMHVLLRRLAESAWVVVLACCAMLAGILAIFRTAFVPSQEMWYVVPLLQVGKDAGFLHPAALSLQVMEHLIAVPMALIVLPYQLFGVLPPLSPSNVAYLNILNVGCSFATMAMLLLFIRKSVLPVSRLAYSGVAIVAVCVGLTFSQWELWTVPSIALTLATALVVAAVAVASAQDLRCSTLIAAGLLCVLATFTFASGMLSWIALLPCIALANAARRWKFLASAAWLSTGALAVFLARSQLMPAFHPVPFVFIHVVTDTLGLLAFPLAPHSRMQPSSAPVLALLGFVLCVLAVVGIVRGYRQHRILVMQASSLFAFSLLQALAIAASRPQHLDSRYIGLVFPGVVMLLALVVRLASLRSSVVQGFCVSIVLASAVHSLIAFPRIEARYASLQYAASCLETYDIAHDSCIQELFFQRADFVREYATMLDALGFLQRFSVPADAAWSQQEHLDRGYMESVTRSGATLTFWGWAREADCGARHIVITTGSQEIVAHTRSVLQREGLQSNLLCGKRFGWVVPVDAAVFAPSKRPQAWVYDRKARTLYALPKTQAYTSAENVALRTLPK